MTIASFWMRSSRRALTNWLGNSCVDGVREARLGLHRAGLRVDLVVERREVPLVELLDARAVERGDGKRRRRGDAALDLGHAILRHRELDVDRRDLGDHRHAVGVAGGDVVARVDRAQPDPAVGRRDDPAIAQVEARRVLVGLVDDDRRLELLDRRGQRVDVLSGDRVLAEQGLVALQLHLAGRQLRLVAQARAGRLLQGDLERPRIDGGDELALLHHLPFAVGNLQ